MRLLCDVPLPPTMNPLGCARAAVEMGSPRRRCLWNAISLSLFPSSLSLSPVLWRIWRYESSLSSSFLGTVKQKSERGGVGARVAGTRAGVNIIAVPAHACTKIKYLRCAIHPRIFILSLLRREKTVHRHDDALRGITMRISPRSHGKFAFCHPNRR